MERNRKILVSILALLVLSSVIAIVDISLNLQEKSKKSILSIKQPKFGSGIGIVRIEGAIEMSGQPGPFGMNSGAESVVKRLKELETDSRIKAVVVRINSPGGTVAATQEIYEKILKLRKRNIPVVATMGDVAASGGYYVASACNKIFANHGTITGSIGVIAMSPNLKKLFEKFGIGMNVIKSGKYKDTLATYRDLSKNERELLQRMIDSSYKKFLKDVAKGRNLNQSEIAPYADGRVMIGETALKYKLIDSLGTFDDAIDEARKLAELPENSPVYDEGTTPFEQFLMSFQQMFNGKAVLSQFSKSYDNNYRLEYRYMR